MYCKKLSLFLFFLLLTTSLYPATYYWIGGSGNWNDLSHWATSSGGSVTYLNLPTSQDDVIFDGNSFTGASQTVSLNVNEALCRNMSWAGVSQNPTFSATNTSNKLRIYGSLTMASAMNWNLNADVYFEANTSGHTITSSGKTFQRSVYLNAMGSWTLQDALSISSNLFHVAGTLNTNAQTLTIGTYNAQSSNPLSRTLNMANSTMNISGYWYLYADLFTLNATGSTINFTTANRSMSNSYYNCGVFNLAFNQVNFTATSGTGSLSNSYSSSSCRIVPTFNGVQFGANGTLTGDVTIGTLQFSPGGTYTLQNGRTVTISNSLLASGGCSGAITLKSSSAGQQAFMSKSSGSVTLTRVNLQDINFSGGATWTASNSFDLGNNTGISISSPPARTLYWVGNGGNWDDPNRWSLTSGGAGGECIPNSIDHVIFDANSFSSSGQTVSLNTFNALCKDMTWTGVLNTPTFSSTATANNLRIHGSLTASANMNWNLNADVYFESSTSGNTITSAGRTFQRSIYFNGVGTWTLQDAMSVSSNIFHVAGHWNTNGQTVTMGTFNAQQSNPLARTLTMTNSTFNISGYWYLYADQFTLNATGSIINFTTANRSMSNSYYNCGVFPLNFNQVNFTAITGTGSLSNSYSSSSCRITPSFQSVTFNSNGTLTGDQTIGTLIFTPGGTYTLQNGRTIDILNQIQASGNCTGSITIKSSQSGQQAFVTKSSGSVALTRVNLNDLNFGGGATWTASNSFNLGNNTGIVISSPAPRTLYWVSNGGNWDDPNRWSLSSGGVGGECIPSSIDDVIFNANSFNLAGQTVSLNTSNALCRNMTWTGVAQNPSFTSTATANNLRIHGSLVMAQAMNWNLNADVYFESAQATETITSVGKTFQRSVYINGQGTWTLTDSLTVSSNLFLQSGQLVSAGQNLNVGTFNAQSSNPLTRSLNISNSHMRIGGYWYLYADQFTLTATGSTLSFTTANRSMSNSYYNCGVFPLSFDKVIFTANSGTGSLSNSYSSTSCRIQPSFNLCQFNANGNLTGDATFGTLIFSANSSYVLPASRTQTITNTWLVLGSCTGPILLSSSSAGTQALVSKSSGTVNGFYLQIRDVAVGGGASFNAMNSVDQGNNSGWVFGTLPPLGQLGTIQGPTVLCGLSTANFQIAPVAGAAYYTWTLPSGSTLQSGQFTNQISAQIGQAGQVCVTATDGCTNSSNTCLTVSAGSVAAPVITASGPVSFCAGDSVVLSSNPNTGITWSNGATGASLTVTQPGTYTATYTDAFGCTSAASAGLSVAVLPSPTQPVVTASGPLQFCAGDSVVLSSSYSTGNQWSTGGSQASLTVNQSGTYSVQVTGSNGCVSSSTPIQVQVNPTPSAPTITASGPTQFCSGGTVVLQASGGNAFVWSNGATTAQITVNQSGTYTAQAQDGNGCLSAASSPVSVTVFPAPVPSVVTPSGTVTLCQGDSVFLMANPPLNVVWTNGVTQPTQWVTQSGSYQATYTDANGCTAISAATQINVQPLPPAPVVSPTGPLSQCGTGPVTLQATSTGPIIWSDGSAGNTLNVSQSGGYFATTTDANGCTSASSNVVSVALHPIPLAPVLTPGGNAFICQGGTLVLQSSAGTATQWSTGATGANLSVTQPGSYTAFVISVEGCTSAVSQPVIVQQGTPPAPPVITANGPVSICPGGQVQLQANAGPGLSWNLGGTSNPLVVTQPGTYFATFTDAGGCTSAFSNFINVVLLSAPNPPIIQANGPLSFCAGGQVTLTVQGNNPQWSTGAQTSSISVSQSGSYSATLTGTNGCSSVSSIPLVVNVFPLPVVTVSANPSPSFYCTTDPLVQLSAQPSGGTWSGNGWNGAGFSPGLAGVGTHTVTYQLLDSNGCTGSQSLILSVQDCNTGLDPNSSLGLSLFPNPTANQLTLSWDAHLAPATIQIFDMQGRKVWMQTTILQNASVVQVEDWPAGVYQVHFFTAQGMHILPFVKN